MFSIMSLHTEGHNRGKSKITCIARELKNCVGRCRWETVSYSQRPKGKVC